MPLVKCTATDWYSLGISYRQVSSLPLTVTCGGWTLKPSTFLIRAGLTRLQAGLLVLGEAEVAGAATASPRHAATARTARRPLQYRAPRTSFICFSYLRVVREQAGAARPHSRDDAPVTEVGASAFGLLLLGAGSLYCASRRACRHSSEPGGAPGHARPVGNPPLCGGGHAWRRRQLRQPFHERPVRHGRLHGGTAGDDLDDRQDPVRRSAKDRVTKLEFAGLRFLSLTRQWNQDGDFLPDPTEGI